MLCSLVQQCSWAQGDAFRLSRFHLPQETSISCDITLISHAVDSAAALTTVYHCVQVIAPYDAEDSRGLLKAAIRDPDPVVFLENEILYGESFPVSDEVLGKDFVLPIGKAKVRPTVLNCLTSRTLPWTGVSSGVDQDSCILHEHDVIPSGHAGRQGRHAGCFREAGGVPSEGSRDSGEGGHQRGGTWCRVASSLVPAAAKRSNAPKRCCSLAAQVINLRTLKPLDRDTIVASVKKTHRVISAEEGWPQSGVGSEIIAMVTEEAFVSPPQLQRTADTGARIAAEQAAVIQVAIHCMMLTQP